MVDLATNSEALIEKVKARMSVYTSLFGSIFSFSVRMCVCVWVCVCVCVGVCSVSLLYLLSR